MNLHHLSEFGGFSAEKLRKHGVFSTPRFFLDVYCLHAGQAQSPHAHPDADKVYLGLEGSALVQIGAEEHALPPGAVVHCPAGVVHGVSNPGPADARVLVFMTPNPGKP